MGQKVKVNLGGARRRGEYDWNMLYEFFKEIILKEEENKLEEAK